MINIMEKINRALFTNRPYSREREIALEILASAIEAVNPYNTIMKFIKLNDNYFIADGISYDLKLYKRIFVIGAGKAAASMSQAVFEILGDMITEGFVNVKSDNKANTGPIKLLEAGHPLPDENSIHGTKKIIEIIEKADENDLVICLLSGGGSALLTNPENGITLDDIAVLTDLLLKCGADIKEINCIRKHIDKVKGGKLAEIAYPATVISLILSDTIDNNLDIIASGPTTGDSSTFSDALEVLRLHNLLEMIPVSIIKHLKSSEQENPRPDEPVFSKVKNIIIGSNRLAVEASVKKAREKNFNTIMLSTCIEGEAKECAKFFVSVAKEILSANQPINKPAAIIAGGETTVIIKGKGKGGRNQEMALSAAICLENLNDIIFLSSATDGSDGPTDASGGIVDSYTLARGKLQRLNAKDYLYDNDSYNYLKSVEDLIITGPTDTNVNDLIIILVI